MIVRIRNLKVETLIGAYPAERKAKREVILNLAIDYDPSLAIASDKLEDALDYDAIVKAINTSLPKQTFHLMEALASHVAHLVLAQERVREVTVSVDKPGAVTTAESVAVEYRLKK